MKENKITIIIDGPIEEVFEFTTNPANTHKWISSIQEEIAEEFPPKVCTQYKNRGKDTDWSIYTVTEYEPNRIFSLSSQDSNYHVRYTYRETNNNQTELEYLEWMENGELENPLPEGVLQNLKEIIKTSG